MPHGTAHSATSSTIPEGAPRRRIRHSVTRQAATIPTTMQSAYARTGTGPTCQTPWLGLGRTASGWCATAFTDAHATPRPYDLGLPGFREDDSCAQHVDQQGKVTAMSHSGNSQHGCASVVAAVIQ